MFADLLRIGLAGIVELSQTQIEILQGHYELLVRWNKVLNLTRIADLEKAVERHYGESLFLAAHLPAALPDRALKIADIGSGAGFPGFPVAVLRPDCQVTLIESHQRKAVFLREASRKLPNVEVLARRAEEVGIGFDLLISRAVSYEDLAKLFSPPPLAPQAWLLTGAEEPPEEIGFVWAAPVRLPWGHNRFLRMGAISHFET